MEQQIDNLISNMGSLATNRPPKHACKGKGLSRYYSGKARSFTCLADVRSVEDLKKPERPDAKRKKYSKREEVFGLPPRSCRRVPSSPQCASPCIGV